jgi:CHAT domain-containing protein/cytochrome c-type biogenesis protein CcmH/NrfG
VEVRLLADESYFEELELVENQLMDQYVHNSISAADREKLEVRLLRGKHQQQKLAFAKVLDIESAARAATKQKTVRWWITPSTSYFKIAAALVIAAGLGLILWVVLGRKSDVDRGMIALNQAHSKERLIQSRISDVIYAPMRTLRSNEQGLMDRSARDYSERLLLDAVNQKGDAASYHALGRLYLAQRDFVKAQEKFEKALESDPNDPQLQSDIGATLLELGQSPEEGHRLRYYAEALQHLNRALELNSSLPEALFNRALVFQKMKLLPQAKEGWRKYLEIDATSPWANEANQNLKQLEEQEKKAYEKRIDLHHLYVEAYRANDGETAWVAIKQSRSRSGNYVVEKLLDEYLLLAGAGKKQKALAAIDALIFAGDIEKQHAGDRYTSDLATFYRKLTARQFAELMRARQLFNSGRERYDRSEFEASITLFTEAKKQFDKIGDECESLFAESWIGYNELRLTSDNSQRRFERLNEVYSNKSYQSLLAQSLHATSDALTRLNEFSRVLDYAGRALTKAEAIEDDSTRLRCLQQFISMNLQLGNFQESLTHGMNALEVAPEFVTEPKLIWTFYQELARAFSWLNFPSAALEFQREALRLARDAQWPLSIARSYTQLGIMHQRRREFDLAIQAGLHAITEGQKIEGEKSRLNTISHANLRLGHIYREAGEFRKALESYDQALSMFGPLGLGMFLYEAHKGKFMAHLAAGNDTAAEDELTRTLALFETYRGKIVEERNRNAFFDAGQDIYDLAIDFALTKLKKKEQAFDYAEVSRARALLELIYTNPPVLNKSYGLDIEMVAGVHPRALSSFQHLIPDGVAILEYAVLYDKVVIWVITSSKLEFEITQISKAEIQRQTLSYIRNVANNGDTEEAKDHASSLYRILISPIEKYLGSRVELCIVPDKTLCNLPFAALVSPDTGKFLIENYRLVVSPSANVFIACTENASQKEPMGTESVLSVGNPRFSHQQFPDLSDLPSAAREAEEVAATYNSTPLLGQRANESQIRIRMAGADVIHFATHYVIDPPSPLNSRLILSPEEQGAGASHQADGALQAFEIYGMKLPRTRLAVLSACQTGVERTYQGEGAIGIARSFISAGVPVVVASLWPVDSDATAPLMIKFHQYRKTHGLSVVEALRMAQRDMLIASDERLHKPYAWAGFVAFGGHTDF